MHYRTIDLICVNLNLRLHFLVTRVIVVIVSLGSKDSFDSNHNLADHSVRLRKTSRP